MKKIFKIIYYIFIIFVIVVAILVIGSILPEKYASKLGGFKLFTVESGSMEPAIKTGSLVIVKSAKDYKIRDIITFKNAYDPRETTTHRIVEIKDEEGKKSFIVQGDANNAPDSDPVEEIRVLGKVRLSIPYIGYPVSFAKTTPGLIILIIIPATIIVYDELRKIGREVKKMKR